MTQTILLVGSFIGSTVDHQTKQETHWWTKVSISLDEDTGSLRLDGYGNSYYGTNKRMTFVLIGFAFNLMKPIKMAKIHFNESGQVLFLLSSFFFFSFLYICLF